MPKKILIADDSRTVLLFEEFFLKKYDFELITATDGQEAFDLAVSEQPDLILMDVMMPNMSGLEATEKIRANKSTSEIPIIVVTTHGSEEQVKRAYAAGCTDYLKKPFEGLDLLKIVQKHLQFFDIVSDANI